VFPTLFFAFPILFLAFPEQKQGFGKWVISLLPMDIRDADVSFRGNIQDISTSAFATSFPS
jgi:hypothetical protein